MVRRVVRLLGVAVALAATSRGVWWLAGPPLRPVRDLLSGSPGQLPLEQALVMVLAATALAGWAWCVVTGGLLAVDLTVRGTAGRTHAGRFAAGCPAPVRAVVLVLLGAGAASALAVPAHADGLVAPVPRPAAAVTGLPVPDRQAGWSGTTADAVHVVRRGESLWSIAADRLPPGTSLARVDRAWRRLYAANRVRVGPDPDLISPGTPLTLPHPQSRKDHR